jgi:hypothetical protein
MTVEVFPTAQAFLSAPRGDAPGCLVFDVRLPGLSGLDLQRELANSHATLPIAGLESRMVNILTGQAEVRPELALAILERKFPQRWAKVSVVAAPPHHLNFTVADILGKVQERIAQGQLPPATSINASVKAGKPHDPRPPRLTVVANPAEDAESQPT